MKTQQVRKFGTNGTSSATFSQMAHSLGREFALRAAAHDENDAFVSENYEALKAHKVFSAMIPAELGGGGIPHSAVCDFLRIIGSYCGSTGLALSMHQHLIAATTWKYLNNKGGEPVLRKVAEKQWVLVSTGAKDWLESNGTMEKTEGGYYVSAHKAFASQSAAGDVLVTSAPYDDPEAGPSVLHFAVPFATEGLTVLDDWYTMGMRGTGSCTVKLDRVFVPDSGIQLKRPQGAYHGVWDLVLGVALPLIMGVYVGIAERAAEIALDCARKNGKSNPHIPYLLGEVSNQLTTAQVMWKDMVRITNDLDFQPSKAIGNEMLVRKTVIAKACIQTVTLAMEAVGGLSYQRKLGLERLFRDVQGANFHPLPARPQHHFTGTYLLEQS